MLETKNLLLYLLLLKTYYTPTNHTNFMFCIKHMSFSITVSFPVKPFDSGNLDGVVLFKPYDSAPNRKSHSMFWCTLIDRE